MGLQDVMMNDAGFLFFKFNHGEGLRQVMEGGPWMIKGIPLFVFPWDPQQGLTKPEHKSCPLWVKIHNIPLVAFNREGVGRIASAIGVPKAMDEHTSRMCESAWGRPSFAKVLVDVWATGSLKRDLQVAIPNVHGGEEVMVPLTVEYVWEPTQCIHCKVFGHKSSTCIKAMEERNKKKDTSGELKDGEGFTVVTHRKKPNQKHTWRPVSQASTSSREKEVPDKVTVETDEDQGEKSRDENQSSDKPLTDMRRTQTLVTKLRGILKQPPPSKVEVHPSILKARIRKEDSIAHANPFSSLVMEDEGGQASYFMNEPSDSQKEIERSNPRVSGEDDTETIEVQC